MLAFSAWGRVRHSANHTAYKIQIIKAETQGFWRVTSNLGLWTTGFEHATVEGAIGLRATVPFNSSRMDTVFACLRKNALIDWTNQTRVRSKTQQTESLKQKQYNLTLKMTFIPTYTRHRVSTQDMSTHVRVVCDIKKETTIKSSELFANFLHFKFYSTYLHSYLCSNTTYVYNMS